MPRLRLDEALVVAGLAPSRSRARDAVLRGTVTVDGVSAGKPGQLVAEDAALALADPAAGYVSRAALKLAAGLDRFGFEPVGRTVLDLGASTGGFTQVLLERGAARVVAVDVGHGQMAPALAADPRVVLKEGLNARDITAADLGGHRIEAITCDVSFISLKLALPPALRLAETGAWGLFLVKPQFEVGPGGIGKGGLVRDTAAAEAVAHELAGWIAGEPGWRVVGLAPSPIAGGSGNCEFLLGARRG
ncbi:MAG TPA: TlyA family RNA methyltransferase [Afifellaceae bacterium]|nr:TlyA family RNA methyltransferase [Afifellaceae bacterium]